MMGGKIVRTEIWRDLGMGRIGDGENSWDWDLEGFNDGQDLEMGRMMDRIIWD